MIRYGAEAGIPRFKCTPHKLKHATGRLGYEGGMGIPEIQTWLGPVNGKNSMVYMEASEEQAANAVRGCGRGITFTQGSQ
jgi:integrase